MYGTGKGRKWLLSSLPCKSRKGYEFRFGKMEKFQIDGGAGCTIIRTYLMPVKWTPKRDKV